MTIPHILQKIKSFAETRAGNDFLLIGTMMLVASGAFCLGRISGNVGVQSSVTIEGSAVPLFTAAPIGGLYGETLSDSTLAAPLDTTGSSIFASKNGTKYYFPGCSSRVKEENKIWFTSEAEAQAAGFTISSTCK